MVPAFNFLLQRSSNCLGAFTFSSPCSVACNEEVHFGHFWLRPVLKKHFSIDLVPLRSSLVSSWFSPSKALAQAA